MFDLTFIKNLDLISVGIVVAATGLLGFVAILSNPKSLTSKLFFVFTAVTILWSVTNYLSYQLRDPFWILWTLRLEIFYAAWLVYILLSLLVVFPEERIKFPDYLKLFSVVAGLVSVLNLSPFVFQDIESFSPSGQVQTLTNGPAIPIFGIYVFVCVISALWIFLRKTLRAEGLVKKQFRSILLGIGITFALLIIFNFLLPAFFENPHFISLGGVFIFPLIFFTAYAIMRHKLLNLKILSTEILTFVLAVALLLEVIFSKDAVNMLFQFSVFLLVLGVGFLLVKSVRREVQQREQLQTLTTQLGEANDKLKALDLARAEFISIASHQLRTPPATIKWYLSSVLSGDYGKIPGPIEEKLKVTQLTNNHLISLIEDMLNVSRIERGKMEFLFESTNVEELARLAHQQLVPIAESKKLKLVYESPTEKLPDIMADKEKLRRVMNNMIDNAIKYTKAGTVTVRIFKKADVIQFEVKDSGKGISEEDRKAIFQKYSRGKESIKQSAGLGLGLYVAKIIIEQHKGKIWAESEGEGKGSTFIFSIPIHNNLKQTTLVDLVAEQQNTPHK